jgi:hypothetical protein
MLLALNKVKSLEKRIQISEVVWILKNSQNSLSELYITDKNKSKLVNLG